MSNSKLKVIGSIKHSVKIGTDSDDKAIYQSREIGACFINSKKHVSCFKLRVNGNPLTGTPDTFLNLWFNDKELEALGNYLLECAKKYGKSEVVEDDVPSLI
jgi:hypothetical protein